MFGHRRPVDGLDVGSVIAESIDRFFKETPVEERGAVYAVIRMPQERTEEILGLIQAIAQGFGKEIGSRALYRLEQLARGLNVTMADLQPILIAAIEKRPVNVDDALPRFVIPCVDDEAGYFIDRLGLEPGVKIALIQAINDMESKRKPEDVLGAREVAQFLEAMAIELRRTLEPNALEEGIRTYFMEEQQRFDAVFDDLAQRGLDHRDVSQAYCNSKDVNLDWVRAGREWMHTNWQRIEKDELARCAPPVASQLDRFMTYLQSKISHYNWQALRKVLKITRADAEGITFAVQSTEELREWIFQMERAALFLNPVNRNSVEIHPFQYPELAVVLHQYRSNGGVASSKAAEDVQALRRKFVLSAQIVNPDLTDTEFKKCAGELISAYKQEGNPSLRPVLSMIGAARSLQAFEREFVLESLTEHL